MNEDLSTDTGTTDAAIEGKSGQRRRRMLIAGIAVAAAGALAIAGTIAVLQQPDPDPASIFDRAESDLDREWAAWISTNLAPDVTAGPRVIEWDDETVGLAFRVPAVAGARSTEWDPYCLYVVDSRLPDAVSSASGTCVLPERVTVDGLVSPIRPDAIEGSFDTVVWGPTGPPRIEPDVQVDLDELFGGGSVVDRMALLTPSASGGPDLAQAIALVEESDRLLLGPSPLSFSDDALGGLLSNFGYVLRGESPGDEQFCAVLVATDGTAATGCEALSTVRVDGLEVPLTATGSSWILRVDPDGPGRMDTVEQLE